jgi:hypothetical protein
MRHLETTDMVARQNQNSFKLIGQPLTDSLAYCDLSRLRSLSIDRSTPSSGRPQLLSAELPAVVMVNVIVVVVVVRRTFSFGYRLAVRATTCCMLTVQGKLIFVDPSGLERSKGRMVEWANGRMATTSKANK